MQRLTKNIHYSPISSFKKENTVFRGPFKDPLLELEKYQRLEKLFKVFTDRQLYIPDIQGNYLVFPYLLKDGSPNSFKWEFSSKNEKFFILKNLFLRFLLNVGGGSFEMFLYDEEVFLHIDLDVLKLNRAKTLVELILVKVNGETKREVSNFIYENLNFLSDFLNILKNHLSTEEQNNYNYLKQLITSRNITFFETIILEPEKKKRGPKRRVEKNIQEKAEKRDRSVPNKINFEHDRMKKSENQGNLDIYDFLGGCVRTTKSVVQEAIFSFILEYLSFEDICKYGQEFSKSLISDEIDLEELIKVYLKIINLDKPQEVYIMVMKTSYKKNITWGDVDMTSLGRFRHMIKNLPYHPAYFYELEKYLQTHPIKNCRFSTPKISLSDVPKRKFLIDDFKGWIHSSLRWTGEERITEARLFTPHQGCPDKEIRLLTLRLLDKNLPCHPSVIHSIYHQI